MDILLLFAHTFGVGAARNAYYRLEDKTIRWIDTGDIAISELELMFAYCKHC